ncbi:hypothetical protein AB0C13_26640 [Streptomyces sp. NPDC049099]|uniref:hypothetical protein n=1 Tax=Streptomyces sp. NPDC049099 TaxID=3155768 RepID=UPI003417D195
MHAERMFRTERGPQRGVSLFARLPGLHRPTGRQQIGAVIDRVRERVNIHLDLPADPGPASVAGGDQYRPGRAVDQQALDGLGGRRVVEDQQPPVVRLPPAQCVPDRVDRGAVPGQFCEPALRQVTELRLDPLVFRP